MRGHVCAAVPTTVYITMQACSYLERVRPVFHHLGRQDFPVDAEGAAVEGGAPRAVPRAVPRRDAVAVVRVAPVERALPLPTQNVELARARLVLAAIVEGVEGDQSLDLRRGRLELRRVLEAETHGGPERRGGHERGTVLGDEALDGQPRRGCVPLGDVFAVVRVEGARVEVKDEAFGERRGD